MASDLPTFIVVTFKNFISCLALERGHGLRFVTLSHNLIRGAAGGSLLNAELCRATGILPAG